MIRKSRAVELMQSNMPLPAVQKLLGHLSPGQTATYVSFSEEDIRHLTKRFMERESGRKTSARNSFFGKIRKIRKGSIQAEITLTTIEGLVVTTVITNESLERLGLKAGALVTAEVKAPWVVLQKSTAPPACTAENRFKGSILKINQGKITTEYIVRVSAQTEVCALTVTDPEDKTGFQQGDAVWVLFNCFSVVLHID